MTESPSFDPPTTVAPRIVPVTHPEQVIRAVKNTGGSFEVPSFQFRVVSEEQNQPVLSVLIIDYGLPGPGGLPWQEASFSDSIPPGKLVDGPRPTTPATATWDNPQIKDDPILGKRNCRTATLLVTHAVLQSGKRALCPVDPNDFDTVTWTMVLCETGLSNCQVNGCPFTDTVTAPVYCDTPVKPQ